MTDSDRSLAELDVRIGRDEKGFWEPVELE